jgi:uncharacterized protein
MSDADYRAGIERQWAARDDRLRDPMGWLSLVGLWWLQPGTQGFGAAPGNEIVLAAGDLPDELGTLELVDDRVELHPASPALTLDGEPATQTALRADVDGEPSLLAAGSLRMHVIRRGDRFALRVRDVAAPAVAAFTGLERFPLDPSWRLVGRLERAEGRTIEIVDVTGMVAADATPGTVHFERNGERFGIDALEADEDGTLWLIFGDATNGRETYGGGRYLYTEPVDADDRVVADFNLAYNPPCVFSSYATCPLPPAQNRLRVRIEAGEALGGVGPLTR